MGRVNPEDGFYDPYAYQPADSPYDDDTVMVYNPLTGQFEDHDQFPVDTVPVQTIPRVPVREGFTATRADISRHLDVAGLAQPAPARRFEGAIDLAGRGGRRPPLKVAAHAALSMQGHAGESVRDGGTVKYVRDARTRSLKYEVDLGPPLTRRGRIFDTAEIFSHYRRKRPEDGAVHSMDKPRLAQAMQRGGMPMREFKVLYDEWMTSLIWVCYSAPGGAVQFFSHVCKQDRFHHSSFLAGGTLVGAGQWVVKRGRLLRISATSGHYLPGLDHLQQSVKLMGPALDVDTQILLYDRVENRWTHVPARTFLAQGSAGGRYKADPSAA